MLRSISFAALTFALTAPPVLAAEKPPISLAKSSKWEINYDEDACHLAARFGDHEQASILRLTQTTAGDGFQITIYGKMLKYGDIVMPIEIGIGDLPDHYKRDGIALTANTKPKTPAVMVSGIRLDGWDYPKNSNGPIVPPRITPAQEEAVTSISYKAFGGKWYRLQTGPMNAPMAAMRTCIDDLQRHWGFDPAVEAGLTRRATPANNPGTWIGGGDFPNKALLAGHNGIVRFRLDVDAAGKPVGCRILFRTNPDEFADLSCKLLMQRAKFNPALDRMGKPVKSYYMSQVRWVAGSDW